MTASEIIKELKAKKYRPIYFLHGEEEYYIDLIGNYIENNVLSEAEKGFNQTVLYGKDTDIITILNNAKRYPMMSEHQVVIVKEAQNIKFGKDKGDKDQDPFAAYIENPLRSTVLVFCYKHGKIDGRLKMFKNIEKNGILFESKKLYDNQVPGWITEHVQEQGVRISPQATALLAEYLGNDLLKISNELEKLMINISKGTEIGTKEIEENIGISKEYNVFEFQNALGKRDVLKANRIVNYFAANKKENPAVVVFATLAGYFSKIFVYHCLKDKSKPAVASALGVNPFFVGDYEIAARNYPQGKTMQIISLLRQYDLKSKGVGSTGNTEEGELMKELVWKILH
ncbi:DNA polymerase III subunit delta [Solitalea canadensis]|uniref:DNA polymerase III subunit delta n=1 Tax=Solitalea canadensis (strain ATCC 29591 / DSM 3403 / JCM 21819 / LMG 8368 / NBRC 15130 / NCIMB 12057 / USAM 9D) TaxID=929556 RepID=H8KUL5_SOLCM|nr:DNA polymerase III subunit delta [Solitalea canadensis]AFD07439.1 DNA polymerase III, delta subunit [Solitalea canadensis DSM 3403]